MVKGIYSANLGSKDFSSKQDANKKNVNVSSLSLRSNMPASNCSLNNLQANYMPLSNTKTVSFCGNVPTSEEASLGASISSVSFIRNQFFKTINDSSALVLDKLDEVSKIQGSFHQKLADDLSIVLATEKDAILVMEHGVAPDIFVQNFAKNVSTGKYANIGLDSDSVRVLYINDKDHYSRGVAIKQKIQELSDEDIQNGILKGDMALGITADEAENPNLLIQGLKDLNDRSVKKQVVFVKNLEDIISQCSGFSTGKNMKEFFDIMYPNLSVIGLVDKKALDLPRDRQLVTDEEIGKTIYTRKHLDGMPKLELPGLNVKEAEEFFTKNPQFLDAALNNYTSSGYIDIEISPKELKEVIAKAAAECDTALPNSVISLLDKMAAAKLNETKSKHIFLKITSADGKKFFKEHKAVFNISKNPDMKIEAAEKITTTMKDLAGLESVKSKLDDVFEYIKDPEGWLAKGRIIPGGLLFTGPPGTGKTEMARAIAGEVKVRTKKEVPFFFMSGTEFGDKYINSGAVAINKAYSDITEYLRKTGQKVGILFIDEADPIGRKISGADNVGATEDSKVTNAWKEKLAGFSAKNSDVKILTIAATNHPEIFDEALLRPERLRQLEFDVPNTKAVIEELLNLKSKKKPFANEADKKQILSELAEMVRGLNGDQMTQILDEATRLASKTEKKVITNKETTEALITTLFDERKATDCTPEMKLTSSFHEFGHAMGAVTLGNKRLIAITNESRGHALASTFLLNENKGVISLDNLIKNIAGNYGGGEAEILLNKVHDSGVNEDFKSITKYIETAIKEWGLGVYTPQMHLNEEMAKQYAPEIRKDVDLFTEAGQKVIKQVLKANKDFGFNVYIKENEEAITLGKDGKNYLGQEFIDLHTKWLKETGRVESNAILKQGTNALIDVVRHDKFWTQKAGIENANYILSNGIESIIGLTQEDKWFANPNKAEAQAHLSKKIEEIVDLAQNGSKWLVENGKSNAEKKLVRTIDRIVDAARKGDKKFITSMFKKAVAVVR